MSSFEYNNKVGWTLMNKIALQKSNSSYFIQNSLGIATCGNNVMIMQWTLYEREDVDDG